MRGVAGVQEFRSCQVEREGLAQVGTPPEPGLPRRAGRHSPSHSFECSGRHDLRGLGIVTENATCKSTLSKPYGQRSIGRHESNRKRSDSLTLAGAPQLPELLQRLPQRPFFEFSWNRSILSRLSLAR